MKSRRFGAVLLAAGVVGGGLSFATAPAGADAQACGASTFCAWTEPGYNGSRGQWTATNTNWASYINNKDSSWRNRETVRVQVYDRSGANGGSGTTICIGSGVMIGNAGSGANDRGGSHKYGGC